MWLPLVEYNERRTEGLFTSLCGSTPTNTTPASVELRSLVFPDIHMAGKCNTRVIAASRRSSSVLPNPEAKHTQTWRYHGQARCGSLFGVRFI